MKELSVIIVCKNEDAVLEHTLESVQGLTADVVLYDSGSQDATLDIARKFQVQLHQGAWEGFGKTKQKVTILAAYDWVLGLDADEELDEELKKSLLKISLDRENVVYAIRRKNYFGNTLLKYGEWGSDTQIRLFNRRNVNWNDAIVHEKLVLPAGTIVKKLSGYIIHRTTKDLHEYAGKVARYAMLDAEKKYTQGKKTSWFKMRVAPGFAFFNNFFLKLGFLDGSAGFICAKMTAYYTFLKNARLRELNLQNPTRRYKKLFKNE